MLAPPINIVFLGLSVTSSWGNGHASTYRSLLRALAHRGHRTTFLERDVPWYADNRDLHHPPYCSVALYQSLEELRDRFGPTVREADLVVVGSYVPDGIEVVDWVLEVAGGCVAFYDIDTPMTLAGVTRAECTYLQAAQIPRFDLYLSFTGGPTLARLERTFGAQRARALICSADPADYYPEPQEQKWALGYLGTYSPDRQRRLNRLLLEPARRAPTRSFVVAGSMYPPHVDWPPNIERIDHVSPDRHRRFYNQQRFSLNLTRADMRKSGYSPSVRLFEAAACGVPVISDAWPGLETFFVPGQEILVASSTEECLEAISNLPESERQRLGEAARARVLAEHTAFHRAVELETYFRESARARAWPVSAREPFERAKARESFESAKARESLESAKARESLEQAPQA